MHARPAYTQYKVGDTETSYGYCGEWPRRRVRAEAMSPSMAERLKPVAQVTLSLVVGVPGAVAAGSGSCGAMAILVNNFT